MGGKTRGQLWLSFVQYLPALPVLVLQVNIYLLVFQWDLSFLEEGELCWSSHLLGGGGCVQGGVG